ncbi:hypothetical protein C8A05DRAFT_20594, partial [Staphylotrichum tortipilum]
WGQEERQRQATEIEEVEQFREILREWSVGCTWCRAIGEEPGVYRGHGIQECMEDDAANVRRTVERVRGVVRWAPYSCCFDCGLPQEICSRYEPRGPAGGFQRIAGRRCQYMGLLMAMVVSLWGAGEYEGSQQWYTYLREQGAAIEAQDTDGWFRWLGRKVQWGGIESNEMCRAVVWLYRQGRNRKRRGA